jgi:hypothetical protein
MRTHKELNYPSISNVPLPGPGPSYERRKPSRNSRNPGLTKTDEQALQRRLTDLIQDHRDLDGAIAALVETRICDSLLMTRLKKRKLQLKDEIARIEG